MLKLSEFTKLLSKCKDQRVRFGFKDRVILNAWAYCPDDRVLEHSAMGRLGIRIAKAELFKSVFCVPDPTTVGDLNLGQNAKGPTWIKLGGEQAHILQVSQSGGGKTNNILTWLIRLLDKCQGIIIFDIFKREYRSLKNRFAEAGRSLSICHGRQMCPAPFAPPHKKVSPLSWGMTISDLLTLALRLPGVSSNLQRVIIHQQQEANGVLSGSEKHPTPYEVTDAVRRSPGNTVLKGAILNRMDALLTELGPDVLGRRQGFSIPELCNRCIVFELDGLSFFAQNFLIAYVLGAIFSYRIACPEERRGMVLVVIEESQRVFSQRAESNCPEGASYFSSMVSLERGAGVKILANVQTTDDLSRSIIANSSIKVMGRLGDHLDYERMGRSMGMNLEQIDFCKKRLRAGLYAVKIADFNEPFIIKTELLDLPNNISDEEAWESGEALRRELMLPTSTPATAGAPPAPPDPEAVLSADEKAYLQAVRNNPNRPSAEYARITGFSNRKAGAVRKALVQKKFLKEWRVEITAHGAKAILLEPLGGPDQTVTHPGRKGNFITQFALPNVAQRLTSEGYGLEFEKGFPVGDRIDYLDIHGVHRETGATVGVEIETEARRGLDNLRMALEVGLGRIIVVACTRNVRNTIEALATKEFGLERLGNVSFTTLSDYLD